MSTNKKITDEQLKKEIRKGKTERQIANDNGYGYPSGRLNQRIRELGFEKNQKLNVKSSGAAQFYLSSNPMQKVADNAGYDLDNVFENKDDNLFFEIVSVEGCEITLRITEDSFKQVENE